jgi:hypothetical protein
MNRDSLLARFMALGSVQGTSALWITVARAWASREAARMWRASVHQQRSGTSCASTAGLVTELATARAMRTRHGVERWTSPTTQRLARDVPERSEDAARPVQSAVAAG